MAERLRRWNRDHHGAVIFAWVTVGQVIAALVVRDMTFLVVGALTGLLLVVLALGFDRVMDKRGQAQ